MRSERDDAASDPPSSTWLAQFHAGDRSVLEKCYRDHASRVLIAARRVVGNGVDAETVTHEVFYRLLSSAKMRESFRGGSLEGWLTTVATRSAIDDLRKRRREGGASGGDHAEQSDHTTEDAVNDELEAKTLIARFRSECLPPEWDGVFDARFLRQLPQREAARELAMPRTTLVYQEQKIRELLQRFLLTERSERSEGNES